MITTETETTLTRQIHLVVTYDQYDNKPRLLISDNDFLNSDDYTSIASQEITFKKPSEEIITAAALGGLQAMKATMRAAAAAAIEEVEGQIQSLLAICHDGGEV